MPCLIEAAVTYDGAMRAFKRLLVAVAAVIGAVLYVWFAAVRAVPIVRRRKAARREARARSS
jgi:hypothetical protein